MQSIESETIERAFAAIKKTALVEKGKVSSEVMGYVSSFGAAVIQAGLVAAVIFFSDSGSDAKKRPELMNALFLMLNAENELATKVEVDKTEPDEAKADEAASPAENNKPKKLLLEYLRAHQSDLDRLEEEILENAIALKLALRSYEKTKD